LPRKIKLKIIAWTFELHPQLLPWKEALKRPPPLHTKLHTLDNVDMKVLYGGKARGEGLYMVG
jgi:hypothetical protein